MKKTVLLAFVAILFFASCEEKPSSAILGRWQITDMYHVSEWSGITHEDLEGIAIYDFQRENKLVMTTIEDGDTTVEDNLGWGIYEDTLIMFRHRNPDEEPGMPGVMLIEELTEQQMRWQYLTVGDVYVELKRINEPIKHKVMGIIITILIGALAGFLAGKIMKGAGFGFWINLLVGIVGGFIGGNVLGWLGIHWGGTLVGQIITAVVGAIILLWVISLIKKK